MQAKLSGDFATGGRERCILDGRRVPNEATRLWLASSGRAALLVQGQNPTARELIKMAAQTLCGSLPLAHSGHASRPTAAPKVHMQSYYIVNASQKGHSVVELNAISTCLLHLRSGSLR